MIDLHCHVLPGIDDGAGDPEEAVRMCELAHEDGCEVLVCTPHQRHHRWWNTDRRQLARLRRDLQHRIGGRPRLLPGAEIRVDAGLLAALEKLPESGVEPLAGSRYLLLELRRAEPPVEPEHLIHELILAGWRPILAHPELIASLAADLERLAALVERGALLQITAMSVTGGFGRRVRRDVLRLLDASLVHFVASDAHDAERRPPGLSAACSEISRLYGEDTARRLASDNPRLVIENRPLAVGAAAAAV